MSNVQADLARILATLNPALLQQSHPPQQQQQPFPPQPFHAQPQPQPFRTHPPPQPSQAHPPPQPQPQPPAPSRPDPRTIKTLPAANRYITRYLARDASLLAAIRALKTWQHAKERAWHSGRVELLKRHAARPESDARVAAFLASMGQAGVATPRKSEKEELLEYDLTVWNKSRGMVKEMEKEMNRLGVPLFLEGVDYGVGDSVLREWRARVVELLEDLCEDEGVA